MNLIVSFMASTAGRIVRILAGIALIAWGLIGLGGATGIIVAVIGAVPLLAGLFDFCLFAPLFGTRSAVRKFAPRSNHAHSSREAS